MRGLCWCVWVAIAQLRRWRVELWDPATERMMFVGRKSEQEAFVKWLEDGDRRAMVVVGNSGMGKSATRKEIGILSLGDLLGWRMMGGRLRRRWSGSPELFKGGSCIQAEFRKRPWFI